MKPQKAEVSHRVELEWIDSYSEYGWRKELELNQYTIKSVGIVVRNTKEFLTITTSFSPDGAVNSPLSIPWCSILNFKQFEKI